MPSLAAAYAKQISDVGSDHWSGPPVLAERMASLAGTRPGHRILDVGCGVGGPARLLHELGCDVVAVDVVHRVVVEARRRTPAPVRLLTADGVGLPIRAGVVDQVWALGALAHLRGVRRFAAEAARVLRRGGTLVITEAFWFGPAVPRFVATAPRPWCPLRLAAVCDALREAGFQPRVVPWPARDVAGALAAADPLLRADLEEGRLRPAAILAAAG